MKQKLKGNSVRSSGGFETNSFGISLNGHTFKILSDGLYSNKIRAVVRETCCNAEDGRVRAGSFKPCEVHLPNSFEPWFSVRDFGCSMTHEQVMKRYTTYFHSDKTHDNSEIGGFGLGCKSPFAISDSFTVETYLNGVHSVYSAYIAEEGIPKISKLSSNGTKEPDGVKVYVPVDRADFERWKKEAEFVFATFEVKPKVTNCKNFENAAIEYKVRTPRFGIVERPRDWSFYTLDWSVIMGNVRYPIDESIIDEAMRKYNLLQDLSVHVFVGIGEVSITPSRESIDVNDQTRSLLFQTFEEVNNSILSEYTKEIDKLNNSWEKTDFLDDLPYNIRQELKKNSQHLLNMQTYVDCRKFPDFAKVEIRRLNWNSIFEETITLTKTKKGLFFIVDKIANWQKKAKWYLKHHDITEIPVYAIKDCSDLEGFKKKVLGGDCPWSFVTISEIEIPKEERDRVVYKARCYRTEVARSRRSYEDYSFDTSKGGYFVESYNKATKNTTDTYADFLSAFHPTIKEFVTVPKTQAYKFKNSNLWLDLDESIEETTKKEKSKYRKAFETVKTLRFVENQLQFAKKKLSRDITVALEDSVVGSYMQWLQTSLKPACKRKLERLGIDKFEMKKVEFLYEDELKNIHFDNRIKKYIDKHYQGLFALETGFRYILSKERLREILRDYVRGRDLTKAVDAGTVRVVPVEQASAQTSN